MNFQGVLRKMPTEYGSPIQYYLLFDGDFLHVNQALDKNIEIRFVGFQCLNCGENRPIYRQGFCRQCFF